MVTSAPGRCAAGDRGTPATTAVGSGHSGICRCAIESERGQRPPSRHGAPLSRNHRRVAGAGRSEASLRVEALGTPIAVHSSAAPKRSIAIYEGRLARTLARTSRRRVLVMPDGAIGAYYTLSATGAKLTKFPASLQNAFRRAAVAATALLMRAGRSVMCELQQMQGRWRGRGLSRRRVADLRRGRANPVLYPNLRFEVSTQAPGLAPSEEIFHRLMWLELDQCGLVARR
jgi:hypothetical protein